MEQQDGHGDEGADDTEDLEESLGYRGGSKTLSHAELAEIERFASIAAWYVLLGVPVLRAWEAANEWLDEHPDELPEGVRVEPVALAAMPRPRGLALLATPPDRQLAPPRNIEHMVPRERAVDLDGEELVEEPADAPMLRAPSPPDVAPDVSAKRTPPRALRRASGAAPAGDVVHRDVKPANVVQPDVVLCTGCKHPDDEHIAPTEEQQQAFAALGQDVARVCKCGCTRFRPMATATQRAAAREERHREANAPPCPALSPLAQRRCGRPGVWGGLCVIHGQRRERGIPVLLGGEEKPKKEGPMSMPRTDEVLALRERLLALLKKDGPTRPRDVVSALGDSYAELRYAMLTLVDDSLGEIVGRANGSRWQVAGETREASTTKAARPPKANGNGHAKNGAPTARKRVKKPEVAGAWEIAIPAVPEDLVESPLLEQLLETRAGLIDHVQKTVDKIGKLDALLETFVEAP